MNLINLEKIFGTIGLLFAALLLILGIRHYATYQYERDQNYTLSSSLSQAKVFLTEGQKRKESVWNEKVNRFEYPHEFEWLNVGNSVAPFSSKLLTLVRIHPKLGATQHLEFPSRSKDKISRVKFIYGFSDEIFQNKLGGRVKATLKYNETEIFSGEVARIGKGEISEFIFENELEPGGVFTIEINPTGENDKFHHFFIDVWYH